MSAFKRSAAGTALFAASTLGVLGMDNLTSGQANAEVLKCHEVSESTQRVQACADDVLDRYYTQGLVLTTLELAGVIGTIASGGVLIMRYRDNTAE